jgi:ubiquinone/menaquinone biosynthesis C-methylase UbiE
MVSDLSRKAVVHTRKRCGVSGAFIADTCRLPCADRSFDLVGVRSGLHHLDDPWAGLAEMARVADACVFFIEGHQTPLTSLWVRLGMIEGEEEAGNKVYRFRSEDVRERLAGMGFTRVLVRTGCYFQVPALISLSEQIPGRLPASLAGRIMRMSNALFGHWGNCLSAVAFRDDPPLAQ